jgi:hypothetical protein
MERFLKVKMFEQLRKQAQETCSMLHVQYIVFLFINSTNMKQNMIITFK